eukprot:CAMPEP_0183387452 /NCGR_PEP_ID=MMETSP0370-20130417/3236_1 /TAXON_ID=268820 /ORGANISM="Peridinium aciculiferum, Strain PAER-2" /LENGTH=107 /DNA_ID=CAMNT_0025566065 /DNA_START=89 /DNA_END=408 /DNA_ORIENTATION=+
MAAQAFLAAQDFELAEELQPLAGDAQAPRNGRRTKFKLAVALGLGLAAAAAYTLTFDKGEQPPTQAKVDASEEKFGFGKIANNDLLMKHAESEAAASPPAKPSPGAG